MDHKTTAGLALGPCGFALGHTYLNGNAPEPQTSALQVSSSASDTGDTIYVSDTMLDTDVSYRPALHGLVSTTKST